MPPTVNMGFRVPRELGVAACRRTGKRVLLAEPRGYCAGRRPRRRDRRAGAGEARRPVYVRKEIVHNRHVVETLAKARCGLRRRDRRGARGLDRGVLRARRRARRCMQPPPSATCRSIDATCPLVTKVHNEAKRFARDDYDILLIGHEGHEEVVGTAGEAPDHVQLVDGPDAVDNVTVRDEDKVIWLSQTTLSVDETMETVQRLRERFPKLQDPPSDDICYATQNRQVAVKAMAPECELVIVVGFAQLVELGAAGRGRAGRRLRRRPPGRLCRGHRPGLARRRHHRRCHSGASVPEVLVRGVLERLAEYGYDIVQPVTTANETLVFALPREIRPARRG